MPKSEPRSAKPHVPDTDSLPELASSLPGCRGCELYTNGTRPVFGQGPASATLVLVGEQPGDVEEKTGLPFVGPAGALLDKVLVAANIDRASVYVTNAVKHFHFEPRGKARLHQRPRATHVNACRPWLAAELKAIQPLAVVLLGATAAASLLGSDFKLTESRGQILQTQWAPLTMATWHPSLALRARDAASRARVVGELVEDLRRLARRIQHHGRQPE